MGKQRNRLIPRKLVNASFKVGKPAPLQFGGSQLIGDCQGVDFLDGFTTLMMLLERPVDD
jgi:hypothetical protein